jgi:hypothetical protein
VPLQPKRGLTPFIFAFALAAVSLLVPSAPTTDAWGWINWGREVVHLELDTVAGPPSWKPLPVLVTAPAALLGSAAPSVWLLVARAGGVLAVYFAYRLAARFAGPPAGVIAAAALVLSTGWVPSLAHGFSEPWAIALMLAAIEAHLNERRTLALVLGGLVALARPEAYPLVVVYAALAVRRPIALAVVVVVPLAWVLPDWWGSGDPFHARDVADVNVTRADGNPALALLRSGFELLPVPVWMAAALAVRRDHPTVAALALGAAAWFAAEIVATALGYPGTARFLMLPAALVCVVAGPGAVWAFQRAPKRLAVPVAAVAAAVLVLGPIADLPGEVRGSIERARFQRDLRDAVQPGNPVIVRGLWWNAGALAWELDVPLRQIRTVPDADLTLVRAPATIYAPLGGRPPEDRAWVPRPRVARCGVRVVARSGLWRVLAVRDCVRLPAPKLAVEAQNAGG